MTTLRGTYPANGLIRGKEEASKIAWHWRTGAKHWETLTWEWNERAKGSPTDPAALQTQAVYQAVSLHINPHMSSETFHLQEKKRTKGPQQICRWRRLERTFTAEVQTMKWSLISNWHKWGHFWHHLAITGSAAVTGPHAPDVTPANCERQETGCLKSRSD